MDLFPYLKSIVDMDRSAVVICNLDHEIIYMNPAAFGRYAKRGGKELLKSSLLACHSEKENKDVYMAALREETGKLIGYYEKHEYRNVETEPFYQGLEEVTAYE